MKKSLYADIVISALFYTTVIATTFVMPMVMASNADVAISGVVTDAVAAPEVWDRAAQSIDNARGSDSGRPQAQAPAAAQARPSPVDRTGPDAEMIRAGKTRVRSIKA